MVFLTTLMWLCEQNLNFGLSNWSFSPYTNRKHQRPLAPLPEAIVISAVQQKHCTPKDDEEEGGIVSKPSRKMEAEKQEELNLQMEFEWVLREEVHQLLKKLKFILISCAHRFPVPLYENEGKKTEKLILSVQPDQLKAILTLTGDTITQADISFKLAKSPHQIQRTSITQDSPWKLQQVQDAANHLQQAINHIDDVDESYHFKTSDEVMHVVGNILEALQRARLSLVIPKKKPIDELIKGRNMKSLSPNLSEDLAVSFYLQSHKLIIAVYQLTNVHGTMRFDSCQAEASINWLNEILFLLSAGLQLCQQLKDKISVFSLYKDFKVGSRASSALSY
ncbi:rogdi atypical leucine zipper isoform X2 [Haematobia irritans]|uniref:rogdi atypical leucine zipper isoform X2 n=1 Tax=Haematobia irritans TaxID=7368 RepID=UPI003F505BE4